MSQTLVSQACEHVTGSGFASLGIAANAVLSDAVKPFVVVDPKADVPMVPVLVAVVFRHDVILTGYGLLMESLRLLLRCGYCNPVGFNASMAMCK